ncbi:MAG: hypothetical protein WAO74_12370 [Polaribacter sp.]|uniref:hypothetical protein n=1 Tax=Polaribacter sp. TaxID=1920175 RepID=UPI003BAEA174
MKPIKILSIVIILFAFSQCKSLKFDNNPPFIVHSGTYYPKETAREIEVYVRYSSIDFVEFDSLFFQNRKAKIEIKTIGGNTYAFGSFQPFLKQDIILDSSSIKELNNPVPSAKIFPFKLDKNQAVLSYKVRGKTKYFQVKSLKEEKTTSF